jgi:hypothetical protein
MRRRNSGPKPNVSSRIVRDLNHVEGQILKVADFYVIEAGSQRYVACNLPGHLEESGTRVVFDAQEFEIPADVRLAGTPVVITKIY